MKLGIMYVLAGVVIAFFLSGYLTKALGFREMMCVLGPPDSVDVKTCKTIGKDREEASILCGAEPSANSPSHVYSCVAVIRDWGQPSPYAHTSHTWSCRAGARETVLFASDFYQDPVRCDLVCGRCETGWQAVP
jgi:hypothetical protein